MRQENLVVHGLWIGDISRLEMLTMRSFVERGHEFHLWRYESTPERLARNVILRDANEIAPRAAVFRKRVNDDGVGLGSDSYATFSDLFRTKLLYEHGGIWVDMDVMCLRPFDFQEPYVFRGHRIGAVMNLIKCPPRSALMGELLSHINQPNENSEWLAFTQAFYDGIVKNGLESFIRWDLMPPDSWSTIKPLLESDAQPDSKWYGIHFLNELWNEVRRTGGTYKSQRITSRLPDKNHPIPGTTLFRWYQEYGLFRRAWSPVKPPEIIKKRPVARQAVQPPFPDTLQLNIALASMALGGAERAVLDVLGGLRQTKIKYTLFLLHDVEPSYLLDDIPGCRVVRTSGGSREERLRRIGLEVLASTTPTVFAHLLRAADFPILANPGVNVIPVVHNSQPAWQDPPAALNLESVPFVVAVSKAVGDQLREWGCRKPIVVLRHEVQRERPTLEQAAKDRLTIRRRYGIRDDTLLIGMTGQFKAQKVYTRAVRVLRALQDYLPAKLMILGGWNQEWGSGRAAYAATCQQALELGVMADLITPGPIHPVDPYYSAFDVFLNTSTYEGLSIAMLEAIAYGCPVVSAPAGGNEEALTANDRLVEEAANIDHYVDAILEVAARGGRVIPATPPDADLVPRLWALLGRHGVQQSAGAAPTRSVLVVTENLNIGGPQRSLSNLLTHWPASTRITVAVLDPNCAGPNLEELEQDGIPVMGLRAGSTMEKCQRALELAERVNATTIAFWNVPAAFKLICAKVLEVHPMRLVDVSPGPMLLHELEELRDYSRRISFSLDDYFARIDCFVAKYRDGIPPNCAPDRVRVIRNGVPMIVHEVDEDSTDAASAIGTEPAPFAIGTCCRIAPSKHIEYLIDMMDLLTQRLPDATLTIVGGADPRCEEYATFISDKIVRAGLDNIVFTGPRDDVNALLRTFSVFVMVSDDQGCPNASLEAMAQGIPVVANASGGTIEQIDDGVNGFLVDDQSPRSMAAAVERLLRDEDLRSRFGAAAQRKAQDHFSMRAMVDGYLEAFGCRQSAGDMLAPLDLVEKAREDQDFVTARP